MQHLLGVACLMAVGVSTPQAEFELAPMTPQSAIAIVASEAVPPSVTDFVVRKRLAPITQQRLIEAALQPDPALPVVGDVRIETAKKVVDQILKETPAVVPKTIEVIEDSLVQEESDGWDTVRSVARSNFVPTAVAAENRPIADIVVDTVKSQANQFIVPDPTDDQFIVAPRPITEDFQEQLEPNPPAVPTKAIETEVAIEPSTPEPATETADIPTDIEAITAVEQPQPAVVEIEAAVETEQIEQTKVEAVDVTVDEAQSTEVEVTEEVVVAETTDVVTQELPTLSAGDAQLMEVIEGWTSLDQSTRQSILLLLRADRVVKSQPTE